MSAAGRARAGYGGRRRCRLESLRGCNRAASLVVGLGLVREVVRHDPHAFALAKAWKNATVGPELRSR